MRATDPTLTIHLSIMIFMPLAAGLLGAMLPRWTARLVVLASTFGVWTYAYALVNVFLYGEGGL